MNELLTRRSGPERLREAKKYTSICPNEAVRMRIGNTESIPISIPGLLARTADKYPNYNALAARNGTGVWKFVTFREYRNKVIHMAKVFLKLGLERRGSVGILAFNCPEWFYTSMAAIHAGGISAGIYTTNSPEAVHHILSKSNANIVVIDDSKQLEKIQQIRHLLPNLKAVIQIEESSNDLLTKMDGYFKWSDLEQMNVDEMDDKLERRLEDIAINECCTLIYTSGTIGLPKGVMLTHDNLTWNAEQFQKYLLNTVFGQEISVSYLPLSHIAAQIMDIYVALIIAGTIYFADRDALKGSLVRTLTEVRPTFFGGVPRVFEKIQENLIQVESKTVGLKRKFLNWARNAVLNHHLNAFETKNSFEGVQFKFANALVINRIKAAIGLDRCKTVIMGAAPLSMEIKLFFLSLNIRIYEVYGMSETSAHCITTVGSNLKTVGKSIVGAETKILNSDENGNGEICARGRHVFMGYISSEDKTRETIDEDGWMHSGDIGMMDQEGNVYITGRLKELIITAGGENIPPVTIEDKVKQELPALSNAFLVGDRKKFLTMLVTIKTIMDLETGGPLDELHPESLDWIKSLGLKYSTLSEILNAGPCPKILTSIEQGMNRVNKKAISNAQKVQKFIILSHDFSISTGELGPTLKVKRNVVNEMYKEIIDNMYQV